MNTLIYPSDARPRRYTPPRDAMPCCRDDDCCRLETLHRAADGDLGQEFSLEYLVDRLRRQG